MASCSQLGLELILWNANNEDKSYQADKCIICQEAVLSQRQNEAGEKYLELLL